MVADKRSRRWRLNPDVPAEGSLISRLLAGRGLRAPEAASAFLQPTLDPLHDPFLLPDMDPACRLILSALSEKQLLAVHGDYDVDGITATAVLVRFLREQGADPSILIPDRLNEGYGLSEHAVHTLISAGCRLLITVDCGTTSVDEIRLLKEAGIRVVVTDHHECGDRLPDADAVVNPRRKDNRYPFPHLAGVGVVLKLVEALCLQMGCPDAWRSYLDLAALGTVADVVPLVDENRCLTKAGLLLINGAFPEASCSLGLRTLLDTIGTPGRVVTAQTLGFSVAPRLNAAGRMQDANDAVRLLLTNDPAEASELSEKLIELNRQRQEIENKITQEAIVEIDSRFSADLPNILLVAREDWHPGVIGIVASRLADYYTRPVIVLTGDEEGYKGSCRSFGEIDILSALNYASGSLDRYGGHRKAAGLTLKSDQLSGFDQAISEFAKQMDADQLLSDYVADLEVEAEDLTLENALEVQKLEPFGEGNPIPLFVCRNLSVLQTDLVGNDRHLKLWLQDGLGNTWDGVAFCRGDAGEWISPGDFIDILFSLDINEWRGQRKLQFNIRDLRPSECGDAFYDCPWEAETLFRTHGSLSLLMKQYDLAPEALLPKNQEYKAVYQYLRTHFNQEPAFVDYNLLARKISRSYRIDLHPFRLSRILCIFQETGLIQKQDLGPDSARLSLLPVTQKVRLEDSPTFRLLAESNGGDPV